MVWGILSCLAFTVRTKPLSPPRHRAGAAGQRAEEVGAPSKACPDSFRLARPALLQGEGLGDAPRSEFEERLRLHLPVPHGRHPSRRDEATIVLTPIKAGIADAHLHRGCAQQNQEHGREDVPCSCHTNWSNPKGWTTKDDANSQLLLQPSACQPY